MVRHDLHYPGTGGIRRAELCDRERRQGVCRDRCVDTIRRGVGFMPNPAKNATASAVRRFQTLTGMT